jgi:hypothetical protein
MSKLILQQLIQKEIKKALKEHAQNNNLDEGFWDNLKAKLSGSAAKQGQVFKNFNAFLSGKKDATVDVNLVKAITIFKQKIKVIPELVKDTDALFPEEFLNKLENKKAKTEIENFKKNLTILGSINDRMLKGLEALTLKPTPTKPDPTAKPDPNQTKLEL